MPRRRNIVRNFERQEAAERRRAHRRMVRDWKALQEDLPEVDAEFIRETRENLRCSRTLFVSRLCINKRTLENWEQGRAKPNSQAVVLVLLVRYFPDTLERLRRIANPVPKTR